MRCDAEGGVPPLLLPRKVLKAMRYFALGVAPLALIWSHAALAGTPLWKVTEISGPVQVKRGAVAR